MNKPQSGYYRQLLSASYPNVRIAFTHTTIVGCTRVNSDPIIEVLKKSDDQFAQYYVNGISSGEMVCIIENKHLSDGHFLPGELYFKS